MCNETQKLIPGTPVKNPWFRCLFFSSKLVHAFISSYGRGLCVASYQFEDIDLSIEGNDLFSGFIVFLYAERC